MDISLPQFQKTHFFVVNDLSNKFLFLLFLIFSCNTQANTSAEYQLTEVANLHSNLITNPEWIQLIANPRDKEQFFLANRKGQIFLVEDGHIKVPALLTLNQTQTLLSENNQNIAPQSLNTQLTAFVLHPDFSLKDQPGYAKFYTAHTETIVSSSPTKRLQARQEIVNYAFDSVITEWKIHFVSSKKIDISSQREVLRVSLVNNNNGINQLSFNPFQKSWNDQYGLLYFSLSAEESLKEFPLYSGALLRVNPNSFGRKSYTVPIDNPYLKDNSINNEIILLGGQKIQQFVWPKKNSEQLLISHTYNGKALLSLTELRNDWRSTPSLNNYPSAVEQAKLVLYKGRDLPLLFKRLLYINKNIANGQLNSLSFSKDNEIDHSTDWQFEGNTLPQEKNSQLFQNHSDEILLIDQANALIYRLSQTNTPVRAVSQNNTDKSLTGLVIFILIVLLIIGYAAFKARQSKKSLIAIVKRSFAYFEVSQDKLKVALYSRHKTMTELTLDLNTLISSEIKLNDNVISTISRREDQGFNDEKENKLRHYFSQEYIDKMVDNKIRQVHLVLNDGKNTYPISVYARRGNKRLTQKRYKEVMEELIDWCWLVSHSINVDGTGKRKPRIALKSTVKKVKPIKPSPLSDQLVNIEGNNHLAPHKVDVSTNAKPTQSITLTDNVETQRHHQINQRHREDGIIDTELVNALEKLVNLKQQGFLTDDEFTQAKEKLLKTLIK